MCPVRVALRELVFAKGLKFKDKVLSQFLQEVDAVAPWFAVSGHLTLDSWDKLGKDLDKAWSERKVKNRVRGLWKVVRSCLESDACQQAAKVAEEVLERVQEQRSVLSQKNRDSENRTEGKRKEKGQQKLYPSLEDLLSPSSESSSSGEEDSEVLELQMAMEGLLNKMEDLRMHKKGSRPREKKEEVSKRQEPGALPRPPGDPSSPSSGPPPYVEASRPLCSGSFGVEEARSSFCPEVWKEASMSFPVFQDAQGARTHEALEFKSLKNLAESVQSYGVSASFTLAIVERLAAIAMTPLDWQSTAKACLAMGTYLNWKSLYADFAQQQARENAAQGQPAWNFDMLMGQGQWVANQTNFPLQVYYQVGQCAVKAWKALPNRGEVSGNLTKIIQGPGEPFSDFVARMMEAAGRIFGDPDTAMPLIEQLIFEQSTQECRAAITPWKGKGLSAWMKACRELGGPLTNSGLAAAVLQLSRGKGSTAGACFHCGKQGHLKRQCPERNRDRNIPASKPPGLCPRCRKGNHWFSECRSVRDISGQVLTPQNASAQVSGTRPKNGQRGPRSQGPQIYGAIESQTPRLPMAPQRQGEPLRVLQDWTSVAPPGTY